MAQEHVLSSNNKYCNRENILQSKNQSIIQEKLLIAKNKYYHQINGISIGQKYIIKERVKSISIQEQLKRSRINTIIKEHLKVVSSEN
jgi:hypothetical protein